MNANGNRKKVIIIYITLIIRYFIHKSPRISASTTGRRFNIGINKNITPPIKLNIRWATAMLMASGDLKSAARSAAIVVPMFAPIINGYTCLNFTLPVATKGTTIDVVIELD